MAVIDWRVFSGQRPRLSSRLLANDEAESAVNAKVWNGKLRAFQRSKDIFTTVKTGPILSVFQYRFDGAFTAWLHWATDVDVVTSPLAIDPNFRLYYTGDGKPKITDSSIAANVTRTVNTVAALGSTSFILNGSAKGFQAGDSVLLDYGSGVTQTKVISSVTQTPGAAVFTVVITTATSTQLNVGRPVTNMATRFPLGAYDLGVPAPVTGLNVDAANIVSGNVLTVTDIILANIGSLDGGFAVNNISEAIAIGGTLFKYVAASFPQSVFITGDQIKLIETIGTFTDPVAGVFPINQEEFATVTSTSTSMGVVTVNFTPPVTNAYTTFASAGNQTRAQVPGSELPPQDAQQLKLALTSKFNLMPEEGLEAVQIDVDNTTTFVLSSGAITRYSDTSGPNGKGAFRFTHFIRRSSDNKILYEDVHNWEIKGGRVLTPVTDGQKFQASVTDTVPDGGAEYVVETIVDNAGNLFGSALPPNGLMFKKKILIRRAARVLVELETADHGLQVGDKIKLDLQNISDNVKAPSLDNKTVIITKVDGDSLVVEGGIGGTYTFGGTYTQIFQADDISPRTYVYTYVATVGGQEMESAPSPPSPVVSVGNSQAVAVSGFVNPVSPVLVWDTNFTSIRLYRFQESETGQGDFLFHSQVAINTTTVNDTKKGDELLEPLSTLGYLPPPETLKGLVELPNGLIAGFDGKELLFPVPFQLHAWPSANKKAVHDRIIAIGAFGTSVAVATEGIPQVFTGLEPASYSPERIELIEPALSKRGSVDMGYGLAYPSERGLVIVSVGRAELVTEDLFTEDEWRQLNPASFVACRFGDRYLCFYDTGGSIPDFTDYSKAGFIIDPKAQRGRLVFLDFWASEAWSDPDTGRTYIVQEGVVREFDRGELEHTYTWRSKAMVLSFAQSMAVAKVEAGTYPVHITFLVEREPGSSAMEPLYSRKVHSGETFPLPDGHYQRWQVELRGEHEIQGVFMATSVEALRQYQAGL